MVNLKEVLLGVVKSAYIHIPFCKSICSYCDFCKMYYNENQVQKYLNALEKEIDLYYKNERLKTIYIGGGTPSSLSISELKQLFSIINKFRVDKVYEFTFECNVEDLSEELLKLLKENKVNRLSIGVESFNEKTLNILGRKYNFNVKDRINLAKKYFSNINIDLIYGVNGETLKDLKQDLIRFTELDLNHISIYSLILENNTILKVSNYQEIDEDLCRDMYDYIVSFLESKGYEHYEISNFAKSGFRSLHNLTYWYNNKYYGFGLGASGYIGNVRYTNTRSKSKYLKGNYRLEEEIISQKIDMENFMILGLRKTEGISKRDFFKRYNKQIEDVFDVRKLKQNKDNYYIDKNMLYISNSILKDFID